MNLSSIRSLIAAVGEYHKDADTKVKAQELIHSLSTIEREEIYRIIKESNPPLTNPDKLTSKLKEIHNVISVKDSDLTRFERILMNIWRAIKDILGIRISDQKLLHKIDSYSKREAELVDARADIPELFFKPSEGLDLLIGYAKKALNCNQEIIPTAEYQILGLNKSYCTFDEIENAYRTILKNDAKDPARLNLSKIAFQKAHALTQVKIALLPDQNHPLTLTAALANYRNFSQDQKNKLTFLIKYVQII